MALTREKIEAAWGATAEAVSDELSRFTDSARSLSTVHARLIDDHAQQWVGIHNGQVQAVGKTLKSVVSQMEQKGLPNSETIVRFITRDPVTLIL